MKIMNQLVKEIVKDYTEAVYIYGSYVFSKKYNDLDILIFIKDKVNPRKIIKDTKNLKKKFETVLDVNYIKESEFKNRVHVDRPISYFIGIKKKGILLWGEDYLSKIKETEFKKDDIKKRLMAITQRARHSFLNNKNSRFWKNKLIKWTKTLILEMLYFEGEFELDYERGINKYINRDVKSRSYLKKILNNQIKYEELWILLEKMSDDINDF